MRGLYSLKSRSSISSNQKSIEPTSGPEQPSKKKRHTVQDSIGKEETYPTEDAGYEDDTSSTHSTRKPTIGANVTLRFMLSGKRQQQQQQQHQQQQPQKTSSKRASTRGLKEFFQTSRSISTESKNTRQTVSALFATQV
jgi:hypothetical protein